MQSKISLILPKGTNPLISFPNPTKEKLKEIEDIFTNTTPKGNIIQS